MLGEVKTRSYAGGEYNEKEILRYAGVSSLCKASEETLSLVRECTHETLEKLSYRVCFSELPIKICGDTVDLGFATVCSRDLAKNLDSCESIILFGASVGIEMDRLIAKYSRISPAKALVFQAIGAERIEALCDTFCKEIAEEKKKHGRICRPRFSPGYGDLDINIQKDIFLALDCAKRIGLTLNASMLMSPTKSVTAIIGVK